MHPTFLYFVPTPEAGKIEADHPALLKLARECGLGDRFRDCLTGQLAKDNASVNHVRRGPNGQDGLLLVANPADGQPPACVAFNADNQEWSDLGGYWIGTNCNPPTPQGLARNKMVAGYDVELANGTVWHCPIVRQFLHEPRIPVLYGKMAGQMVRTVKEHYRRLWAYSAAWCAKFLERNRDKSFVELLGYEGAFDAACECLTVNYRVGIEEVTRLKILDGEAIDGVLEAAIDLPIVLALEGGTDAQKKSVWASALREFQTFLDGAMDSTADTPPAAETSS